MLGFLVRLGANVNNYSHTLAHVYQDPHMLRQSISANNLMRLIEDWRGLDNESIFNIMFRIFSIRGDNNERCQILRQLIHKGFPIFSPNEATDDNRMFKALGHPLSYFISLDPGLQVLRQVLDAGIDTNRPGFREFGMPLYAAICSRNPVKCN